MIHVARPWTGMSEVFAVWRVMRAGQLSQGPEVARFETEFSDACVPGSISVAVNSGTSGLHLGLLALGVGKGDEVIVPAFSFAATANAVVLAGATPVFCDVDPRTLCMDATQLSGHMNSKTKAVIPVHLYGLPADMHAVLAEARKRGIYVVEDSAQAHGAAINGKPVGSFGDLAVFSFYPTKNMTSGEGGMVVTKSESIAQRIRALRNQGMVSRYEFDVVGLNNRMSDLHASIGRVQLRRLKKWTDRRRQNASFYRENLIGVGFQEIPEGSQHVFHQFTIRVGDDRDRIVTALLKQFRVETGIYYPAPLNQIPSMANLNQGHLCPSASRASKEVLSLPVHPFLSQRELDTVVSGVNHLVSAGG